LTTDNVTAALEALADEVSAVDSFDVAREAVVDLIQVRADPEVVYEALAQVYERLERIRDTYHALEGLMIASNWSMEAPDSLPPALRQALDSEVAHHQEHLARTAEAEAVVGVWLGEEAWQHSFRWYRTARQRTEETHNRRAHRRRRRGQ